MGLLDDAIREHLELKRARGADLSEVERQEREALGATPQAEFAPAAEPEAAESAGADSGAESAGADSAEEQAVEEHEPVPAAEEEPVEPVEEREPFDVEALEPAPPAPAAEPDPWLDDERDEVPAGESLAHPREDAEEPPEDVLEDTPEFLQETPEHDRLWFEQRPPRDFDWDK
jgi:hypothetical protein